jgi:uncharacterized SAM-binding protein YcdF (DUF218 family)
MSFLASKLLWAIAEPSNLASLLFLICVAGLWTRWRRWARYVLLFIGVVLLCVGTTRIGDWMLRPLEFRFPIPPLPEQIDGIIVLGGFINPALSHAHGQPALTADGTRLVTFLALARKYPEAKVVFSGGNSIITGGRTTEASVMRQLLDEIGLNQDRVIYEDRSRNTYENALFTKAMVDPPPNQAWVLVTSAANMPRAVGSFRHVGWNVIPYPTDYKSGLAMTIRTGLPITTYVDELSLALHEWIGLAAYRLMGRTDAFFPNPA